MDIKEKTIELIDSLKATCQSYGMGNDGNEYKIITQVFLYKFLHDKFGYEVKQLSPVLASAPKWDEAYTKMSEDERLDLFDELSPDVPRLKPEHLISHLWNQQGKGDFDIIFDRTMTDIAYLNRSIFSTESTQNTKIPLFEDITIYVTDEAQRAPFARALVDKLVSFSFEEAFCEHYDFFAAIFEYLIKDYNTAGGGKYAEYYTPHAIATIMARLLVGDVKDLHSIECYDPSAGTGTLLMALAHQVGEDRCTIFSQDISQRSNKMLKLNLILNGLVSSLDHVIQGDTLVEPYHKSDDKQELRQFDYVVSNPPFKMDFSDTREKIAAMPARFWAGVPKVPAKELSSMAIYTCFIQHVLNSTKNTGKAAIVVPSGFLTDTSDICTNIRDRLISERILSTVIQMPTNVFATTNTSVSVIFIDKGNASINSGVLFIDATKLGTPEKISDKNLKTVFSEDDVQLILNAASCKKDYPEFSKYIRYEEIQSNGNFLKPGLYFEMKYSVLGKYCPIMDVEFEKIQQRKKGLIRILRSAYARNLFSKWFINFDLDEFKDSNMIDTEYGLFPEGIKLVSLNDLIDFTIGGEWGKETPTGNYNQLIKCIRGTDIPNICKSYYDDIPSRYVKKKHIDEKRVLKGDIIIEISGGSPIQSTGRICLILEDIIHDINTPILCTNFCRIIRLKDPRFSEYVYNYLQILYDRGYFFNLENNTTGIKNLIYNAFIHNIKVPIPEDLSILDKFNQELELFTKNVKI